MYTSGSSGTPKGVMITHKSVIRLVRSANYIELTGDETLLATGSLSFDATTFEYWSMLLNGGKLILCRQDFLLDPTKLAEEIRKNNVDTMWITAGWLNHLVDKDPEIFAGLATLLAGGEKLSSIHIQALRIRYPDLKIINGYGPTENTTFSLTYPVTSVLEDIPIGKPISNSTAYILDRQQQLLPINVIGEIFVGGDGLAKGYLNNPDLTAEKFLPHPFKKDDLIYRTGDLGRWLPDGNIAFAGRADDQVKIRGYRVEPGEIAGILQTHPDIDRAIVVVRSGSQGEKELVAYIVSEKIADTTGIHQFISNLLPDYMVPAHFVRLDSLPLTLNGKIDKRKLPDPNDIGLSTGIAYIAPRNQLEERLTAIWQEVLGKEKIGVKEDFFVLGGHSLKITRLASQIYKEFDVKPDLNELFARTILEDQASWIGEMKKTPFSVISPAAYQADYPLSSSQQRLWVLSQFKEGNIAYNMPGVYRLEGQLDVAALEWAFEALIERHEILRTIFKEDGQGDLRQFIRSPQEIGFKIAFRDLRPEETAEKQLNSLIRSAFIRSFDLATGPLLRAGLYQVAENSWIFTYVMHHIISDGWSMGILIKELLSLYNARIEGIFQPLPPLKIQYKDYAVYQQEQLTGGGMEIHKSYWLRQFEGVLPVLELPADRSRPAIKTYNGAAITRTLPVSLVDGIKECSHEQGATLFMGLMAAINALLYRYTGQKDIIIGCPVAGREHIDLDGQIGFYVNTLALRTRFEEEDSYRQLIVNARSVTLEAYHHQSYPFDELLSGLDLQRDMSRDALFDVMVVLQNMDNDPSRTMPVMKGLTVSTLKEDRQVTSKFDLLFDFAEIEGELRLRIEYNTDIYEKDTIERLASHLRQFLHAVTQNPDLAIGRLEFLTEEEKELLLIRSNNTAAAYPDNKTMIGLWEEQVQRSPDNTALLYGDNRQMTYKELNAAANKLGDYLRKKYRITPDELTAIKLDRNEWLIIAILATLKSGGAYVPIDPDYPQDRISYMLEDSKCKVLIDEKELADFREQEHLYSSQNLPPVNKPEDLLYVIYTSGSSGQPKGAMIRQRSFINLACWYNKVLELKEYDRVLLMAPVSFDLAQKNIFTPLLWGASLCLPPEPYKSYEVLVETILKNKVTVVNAAPSAFYPLLDETVNEGFQKIISLKKVVLGGEPIIIKEFLRWRKSGIFHAEVINSYGPTECTDVVAAYKVGNNEWDNIQVIPIGTPVDNCSLYILDNNYALAPTGITGEIFIAGECLGRGYLHQPALTAEKFIPHPFRKNELVYRTGDLGRRMPDGNITF
ncbi:MAG: amino acid adenylation domain-containing protein, partial [Bacteroidota bacterium]